MHIITDLKGGSFLEGCAVDRSAAPTRRAGSGLGKWVLHPFFLTAYPVLALLSQNAREVRLEALSRLICVVLVATLVTWLFFSLVFRDMRKAGLLASLAAVLFFTIDITHDAVNASLTTASNIWVPQTVDFDLRAAVIADALLLAFAVYLVKMKVTDAGRMTAILNVFSVVLIAMPVAQIVSVKTPSMGRPPRVPAPFTLPARPELARLPDIYYIILDGYARADVMKSFFDFDNTPFLDRLEKQGFYLARQSIANYCQTPLCLSASLNSVYLDDLVKGLGPDQTELSDLIGRNNIVATLKPLGYKFVTFATGFDPTEHPEADVYLSPHPFSSGFERMVVDITPLRYLWPNPKMSTQADMIRQRTLFLLDRLPEVARDHSPTFTFAHVFCPHPPIIFGENGEDVRSKYLGYSLTGGDRIGGRFRDPADFARGYRDQAAFITRRIEETINQILARSPEPPIIILQSDHGSELKLDMTSVDNTDLTERMSILNAYYFPDRKYGALYSGISPVNSFRVVLNTYFGAHLELLPDRSFFSTWADPYRFIDVTDAVQTHGAGPVSPRP